MDVDSDPDARVGGVDPAEDEVDAFESEGEGSSEDDDHASSPAKVTKKSKTSTGEAKTTASEEVETTAEVSKRSTRSRRGTTAVASASSSSSASNSKPKSKQKQKAEPPEKPKTAKEALASAASKQTLEDDSSSDEDEDGALEMSPLYATVIAGDRGLMPRTAEDKRPHHLEHAAAKHEGYGRLVCYDPGFEGKAVYWTEEYGKFGKDNLFAQPGCVALKELHFELGWVHMEQHDHPKAIIRRGFESVHDASVTEEVPPEVVVEGLPVSRNGIVLVDGWTISLPCGTCKGLLEGCHTYRYQQAEDASMLKQGLLTGPWTDAEVDRMRRAVNMFGTIRLSFLKQSASLYRRTLVDVSIMVAAFVEALMLRCHQSLTAREETDYCKELLRIDYDLNEHKTSARAALLLSKGKFTSGQRALSSVRRMQRVNMLSEIIENRPAGSFCITKIIPAFMRTEHVPAASWTEDDDRMLMFATYIFGFGRYDEMKKAGISFPHKYTDGAYNARIKKLMEVCYRDATRKRKAYYSFIQSHVPAESKPVMIRHSKIFTTGDSEDRFLALPAEARMAQPSPPLAPSDSSSSSSSTSSSSSAQGAMDVDDAAVHFGVGAVPRIRCSQEVCGRLVAYLLRHGVTATDTHRLDWAPVKRALGLSGDGLQWDAVLSNVYHDVMCDVEELHRVGDLLAHSVGGVDAVLDVPQGSASDPFAHLTTLVSVRHALRLPRILTLMHHLKCNFMVHLDIAREVMLPAEGPSIAPALSPGDVAAMPEGWVVGKHDFQLLKSVAKCGYDNWRSVLANFQEEEEDVKAPAAQNASQNSTTATTTAAYNTDKTAHSSQPAAAAAAATPTPTLSQSPSPDFAAMMPADESSAEFAALAKTLRMRFQVVLKAALPAVRGKVKRKTKPYPAASEAQAALFKRARLQTSLKLVFLPAEPPATSPNVRYEKSERRPLMRNDLVPKEAVLVVERNNSDWEFHGYMTNHQLPFLPYVSRVGCTPVSPVGRLYLLEGAAVAPRVPQPLLNGLTLVGIGDRMVFIEANGVGWVPSRLEVVRRHQSYVDPRAICAYHCTLEAVEKKEGGHGATLKVTVQCGHDSGNAIECTDSLDAAWKTVHERIMEEHINLPLAFRDTKAPDGRERFGLDAPELLCLAELLPPVDRFAQKRKKSGSEGVLPPKTWCPRRSYAVQEYTVPNFN